MSRLRYANVCFQKIHNKITYPYANTHQASILVLLLRYGKKHYRSTHTAATSLAYKTLICEKLLRNKGRVFHMVI